MLHIKSSRMWLVAVFFLGPVAIADTVSMTLTSAGNNVMGRVYINPYTVAVNNVLTQAICNDFAANTYLNETWKATVSTFDDLSSTKWGKIYTTDALHRYNAAAWLTLQLLSTSNVATAGHLSYAIWGIFTPSALTSPYLATSDRKSAQVLIDQAMGQSYGSNQFANFVVYTPVAGTASCGGGPCASSPPQEFLVIRTPESSAAVLLIVNCAALLAVLALLRRRVV